MASKDENSYGKILKGLSMFGSVEVFQILINLVRGKFVAMFLGPQGMGVSSMFTSASNTITQFSSLGLNLAFVKEVAANKEESDKLAVTGRMAEMLIRITSLIGAVACVVLAPWLSRISFGSTELSWQFMLLGVAIFLRVSVQGYKAILQGLHRVKTLSTTSLAGALTGLFAGVPLYYFFGTQGIVPAMIVLQLTLCGFYYFGVRKYMPRSKIKFERKLHSPIIRKMVATGMVLLGASLINTLFTYLINIYIRQYGDLSHVGLFNAANSVTMQYAGVVFTAMALDYFPRLSASAGNAVKMRGIVAKQMEIVAMIATPLAILLIATAPIIIRLLLTKEFMPITPLMRWLGLSILLKAIAYPLGYIAFAKDNRRLFFWLEGVICNILYIGCSLIFYHFYGLMGLGYGAVVEQGACILIYLLVNFKVYGLLPDKGAVVETSIGIILGTCGFIATIAMSGVWSYVMCGVVFAVSAWRSVTGLKSRIKRE